MKKIINIFGENIQNPTSIQNPETNKNIHCKSKNKKKIKFQFYPETRE